MQGRLQGALQQAVQVLDVGPGRRASVLGALRGVVLGLTRLTAASRIPVHGRLRDGRLLADRALLRRDGHRLLAVGLRRLGPLVQ